MRHIQRTGEDRSWLYDQAAFYDISVPVLAEDRVVFL